MFTTLQVKTETRNRLKRLGKKEESYDQLLVRLMDVYEATEGAIHLPP